MLKVILQVSPPLLYSLTFSAQQRPCTPNSSSSSSSAGRPTARTARASDVVFSESFLFHVTPQMLDRCHIVIEAC
ncbi:unnamed protein product [Gongylonema pulchrum]|uniref:Secreted protein n=1 Tax=Gongylonema pulchrum TaxID=637853 RepID=A0A183DB98_9BILA|nr:unnamed protein product [Gongylonema pulchrum]